MADLDKQTILGGLESPFLKGELFLDEATGDMLPTLTRESAFQGAFETSRTQTYENIPLEEVGVINENNWRRIQDTKGVPCLHCFF